MNPKWLTIYAAIIAFNAVLFSTGVTMAQSHREAYQTLEFSDIVIHHPDALRSAAQGLHSVYAQLRGELEQLTGWPVRFRPIVVLVGSRSRFRQIAGDDRIEAFARPHDQVIVIDYSRLAGRPIHMATTFKHELMHLLLHHHITYVALPKWLNEGLAQWASGGVAEVLVRPRKSLIGDALRNDRLPSLRELENRFPNDSLQFSLAYEISLSIVTYIEENFGREAIITILGFLKNGSTVEQAVQDTLGISLAELELDWRQSLKKRENWLTFLAVHIYEFLFLMGALLTMTGFLRYWIKKKNYRDDPEDEDWE